MRGKFQMNTHQTRPKPWVHVYYSDYALPTRTFPNGYSTKCTNNNRNNAQITELNANAVSL